MTAIESTPDAEVPPPPTIYVHHQAALCEGWGECHRRAPDVYPLDAEGQCDIHRLEVPPEHAEDAFWGAVMCPKHALQVIGPPRSYWVALRRQRYFAEHADRADGADPAGPAACLPDERTAGG